MCDCEYDPDDDPDALDCDCEKINSNVHLCRCRSEFVPNPPARPPVRPQELEMFSYDQIPPHERHDYLPLPGMSSGMVSNENPFRRPFDHHDYDTVPFHDRENYLELPVMNWGGPESSQHKHTGDFGDGVFGESKSDERTSDSAPLLPFQPVDWNAWSKG